MTAAERLNTIERRLDELKVRNDACERLIEDNKLRIELLMLGIHALVGTLPNEEVSRKIKFLQAALEASSEPLQ